MHYLALLCEFDPDAAGPSTDEFAADVARYEDFVQRAGPAFVAGEPLQPAAVARTVRPSRELVSEGPFIPATEVLTGFLVLEAPDADAVLDLARQIPAASSGVVELRPLVLWEDHPDTRVPPGATRYLALLYDPPSEADVPGTDAWDEAVAAHSRFGGQARQHLLAGAAVHGPDAAVTLRVRDGSLLRSDGPLIQSVEAIGGLYVFWSPPHQEAVELASQIPVSEHGVIEMRPIQEIGGAGSSPGEQTKEATGLAH